MTVRRPLTLLLAPAGVVTGHALGFLTLHPLRHSWQPTFVTHGLYPTVAAASLVVACVITARVALTRLPARAVVPRLRSLGAAQLVGFFVLEGTEQFAGGAEISAMLHEPALWLAVAAQLAAAALWIVVMRGARRVVSRARTGRRGPASRTTDVAPPTPLVVAGQGILHRGTISRRGPPVLAGPAV